MFHNICQTSGPWTQGSIVDDHDKETIKEREGRKMVAWRDLKDKTSLYTLMHVHEGFTRTLVVKKHAAWTFWRSSEHHQSIIFFFGRVTYTESKEPYIYAKQPSIRVDEAWNTETCWAVLNSVLNSQSDLGSRAWWETRRRQEWYACDTHLCPSQQHFVSPANLKQDVCINAPVFMRFLNMSLSFINTQWNVKSRVKLGGCLVYYIISRSNPDFFRSTCTLLNKWNGFVTSLGFAPDMSTHAFRGMIPPGDFATV